METSIRYGGESSALRRKMPNNIDEPPPLMAARELRIHAKQKLQFHHSSTTLLQLKGEVDTRSGAPTFLCALFRHFYPHLSASLGAGLHYDTNNKLQCIMRAKKAYPVASTPFVNFVLKGRCNIDKDLNQPTPHGALELVWNILDFQKEQDVRLKLGYELVDKIPYVQLRENNWTFNADANGRWNVRYNL
uniref:outer envelope pore protein 21B, chloroplastic-like n=1 Tax=Erigeron canadensis TaxID=72917 RepID=UPI001CB8CDE5|nr:outer envelope pore protein 21B, chloroplastic-like [Erigeron canadensis]